MAFDLKTVSQFIAGLSIAGITIKDYDSLPNEFDSREFPLLAPDVYVPVTVQSVKRDSYGDGTTAKQTLLYLVPYVLACYAPGEERSIKDIVPGVIETTSDVMTAIIKYDTPGDLNVDLTVQAATVNTDVNDPAGHGYKGTKLVLLVKEYIEGVD